MKDILEIDLIELVKQGDSKAYEELCRRYHKLAYYYAYKLCRNDADAKDVVQDTLLEIHRSITSLKENSFFKAWMYKIVSSKCKKLFRKNQYTTNDFEDELLLGEVKEERIEFIPEKLSQFKSDQELLLSFIDRLPQAQSSIITLFYLEQLSLKEISDILEIPIGTVKSRLSYARTYLKKALEAYQSTGEEPLTFHQLDSVLMLALTTSFTSMSIPKFRMKGKRFNLTGASSNVLTNILVGSLSLTVIGAGVKAYQTWDAMEHSTLNNDLSSSEIEKSASVFKAITVFDETIKTSQDAYFTLMEWACCEEMINQKTMEEHLAYQPLYEELKAYGGPFYERLAKQQWTYTYEETIK